MVSPINELVFREAVRAFWHRRQRQREEQALRGVTDQGERGAVTGGAQMAGFAHVISEYLVEAGVASTSIHVRRSKASLPGYYRSSKEWDVVVVADGQLLAAIELKSQVGSFSNNFNNRTEEALGNAVDIWTAFREGAFAEQTSAPWLGYLLLLENSPESTTAVGVQEPHFKVFDEFRGTSYTQRYEILCRKLVRERQYNAACLLMTSRDQADDPVNYTEPAEDLSARIFLTELLRHVSDPFHR